VPLVIYSALRLGLFAALTLLMHFWAGMEWWFAALISVFAAWGLSYTMLDGPRDAAARYLADRAEARTARKGLSVGQSEDAEVEDAAQDAAQEPVERDEP
jgi:Na+/melibiose symporter-like transporter